MRRLIFHLSTNSSCGGDDCGVRDDGEVIAEESTAVLPRKYRGILAPVFSSAIANAIGAIAISEAPEDAMAVAANAVIDEIARGLK